MIPWRMILIQFFSLIQFQECQNLLEENRRLANGNGSPNDNVDDMLMPSSTNGGTVEETVLQTQIETLQWQLNQVKIHLNCKSIRTMMMIDDDDHDDSPLDQFNEQTKYETYIEKIACEWAEFCLRKYSQ